MPSIWNLNKTYNVNNNSNVLNKISLKVGDTFKGRVLSVSKEGEIQIKLSNGMKINATIEGELELIENDLLEFEVLDYTSGNLKLKLFNNTNINEITKGNSNLDELISGGIEDNKNNILLKEMMNYDISLTKDNIKFVKSLVHFLEKIKIDIGEIDKFIDKFFNGEVVDDNLDIVQDQNLLRETFSKFKEMSVKDILLFIENDININKENIDSYNKLFKEGASIKEYFNGLNEEVNSIKKEFNITFDDKEPIATQIKDSSQEVVRNEVRNCRYNFKAIQNYTISTEGDNKVNVINILKNMMNTQVNPIKDYVNILLSNRVDMFNLIEYSSILSNLDNKSNEELVNILNQSINGNGEFSEDKLNEIISNLFGKNINLNSEEVKNLTELIKSNIINLKDIEKMNAKINSEDLLENINEKDIAFNKEIKIENKILSRELIKNEFIKGNDSIKEVVKDIIKLVDVKGFEETKILDFIKSNMNDFKLLNKLNGEYYYMDLPINQRGQEYPCKLIIKDKRKDGKKIDKTNVKVIVTVKTINLGNIDGYLTILNGSIDVNLKCDKDKVNIVYSNREKLIILLNEIGLQAKVSVSERVDEVSITNCREFFNDSKFSIIDRTV